MTASQRIFLAIAQLTPDRFVLTRSVDFFNHAENSNAYVRAVQHISGALN